MLSNDTKQILFDMGADLCGIASVDRFDEAPEGFHPCDVLPSCRSVVVFAKKFPAGTLRCHTTVPYTIVRNMLSDCIDKMAVQFCDIMEQHGVVAIPTGVVLTDAELNPDRLLPGDPCPDGCTLCIDHCPAHALGNPAMDQQACRAYAFHTDEGEEFTFKCHMCRSICPNAFGSRNKHMKLIP